jgi:hypothetical protein
MTGAMAHAATVEISTSGTWSNAAPDDVFGLQITDKGSRIAWGDPVPKGPEDLGPQSAYRFDGVDAKDVSNEFSLGVFTHENFAIWLDTETFYESSPGAADGDKPTITGATLTVDIEGDIHGHVFSFSSVFNFLHDETDNTCANVSGAAADCDNDIVTLVSWSAAPQTVRVGDLVYTFEVDGFYLDEQGDTAFTKFSTIEEQENAAYLRGSYSVAPIPLPATLPLLLGAIGGMVAFGRRKARTA